MADLPTYERSQSLQPQASPGVSSALRGAINAELTLGGIGNQIAQEAANEMARQSATEAAKTPGRKLIPGITQATSQFNKTYMAEEYNNVLLQSKKMIANNAQLASRNPTPGALQDFQKNTSVGLDTLLQNTSVQNRSALQRDMALSYESAFMNVSDQVYAQNQKVMLQAFSDGQAQYRKDINNQAMQGNEPGVMLTKDKARENIRRMEENGSLEPRDASNLELMLDMETDQSLSNYKALVAEKAGRGDEYLKELLNTAPKDGDYAKRDQIAAGTAKFLNQRRSIERGQQELDYLNAQVLLTQGGMTAEKQLEYKEKLNPQNYAKLELKMASANASVFQATNDRDAILAAKNNPAAVAGLPSKRVDGAAQAHWDQLSQALAAQTGEPQEPLSLQQKAASVADWPVAVPSLANQVSAQAKAGSPAQAAEAMNVYLQSKANGSQALSGLPSDVEAMAMKFDTNRLIMPEEEAANLAREQVKPLDAKAYEGRQNNYKFLSKQVWPDYISKQKVVASSLGIGYKELPPGLSERFAETQQEYFMQGLDWEEATKAASEKYSQVYGYSTINGTKEYMLAPPEKYVPGGESSSIWMRNQMVDMANSQFVHMKALVEKGSPALNSYFEFEPDVIRDVKDPMRESMVKSRTFTPDSIDTVRVDKDGNKTKGTLVMRQDVGTLHPVAGSLPSYGVYFYNSKRGTTEPIIDPATGEWMRFTPNLQTLAKRMKVSQEQLDTFLTEYEAQQQRLKLYDAEVSKAFGRGL